MPAITFSMTTFAPRANKHMKKASDYFFKIHSDIDIEKYKLDKYQELFNLSSFQAMHDADLAYHAIYRKCAENAQSKESLFNCLDQEEKFLSLHENAFNADTYRMHQLKAISEVREYLKSGSLDHLYF
jgi:hypothetical protein